MQGDSNLAKTLINYLIDWRQKEIPCKMIFTCCPRKLVNFNYKLLKKVATPHEYDILAQQLSNEKIAPFIYFASVLFYPDLGIYSFYSQEFAYYKKQFVPQTRFIDVFTDEKELELSVQWSFTPLGEHDKYYLNPAGIDNYTYFQCAKNLWIKNVFDQITNNIKPKKREKKK